MPLHLMIGIVLVFVACSTLHAAPAAPDRVEMIQPDGTQINTVLRGDESQNWIEAEETGHTIIRNTKSGYWEYAELAKDGSLRPNGIHVLPRGLNAPPPIAKGIRPPRNKEHEHQMQQMIQDAYQQRISTATTTIQTEGAEGAPPATGDWIPAPVSGSKRLLVILVGFANRAITTTPASWSTAAFDAAAKSVAKYYKENSFDTLTVTPVSHTQAGNPAGIVSVTIAGNHPNTGSNYTFASDQAWGNSALQQAAPFVDFNGLDTNSDGKLDTTEVVIYFVAAGYETSSGSGLTPTMWAHAWYTSGSGLTAGTKNVQRWALNGEYYNATTQMTMGVIAHELGHQMCGLPDLYDISGNNQGLGNFSLMAGGSWGANTGESQGTTPTTLDAWSREYLGWSTPLTPSATGSINLGYALASKSSAYKLILPTMSSTEYFLVENRQPISWDLGLKASLSSSWKGGLLILHIDTTAGTKGSNDINSYAVNTPTLGHQGVVPVQASTASCNMLSVGASCRGSATTLFYSTNNSLWSPTTTPSSNYYGGTATNFTLSSISAPGTTMTAELLLGPTITILTNPATVTNVSQATFSFSSSDPTAIINCKVDGGSYTACNSPYTAISLPDGPHTFSVRATNSGGSSEVSYTWTSDTTPPDTTLTSWPINPTVATAASFSFSSPDVTAIFQCKLDTNSYEACSSGTSYSNLAPGSHTFSVRAIDGAGNIDQTPEIYTWVINACHVKIGSTCYTSIGEAYAMAADNDTILAQAMQFPDSLVAYRGIRVSIRGGFDAAFSNVIGHSSIPSLTIISGMVDVADLAL